MSTKPRNGNGNGKPNGAAYDMLRTIIIVVGTLVPVIGGLWSLGIGPIIDDLKRIERKFDKATADIRNDYLLASVHRAGQEGDLRYRAEYRLRVEGAMNNAAEDRRRLSEGIKDIERGAVSKIEVQELTRRISAFETQFSSLYPLGKVLEDVNRRIDQVRADIRSDAAIIREGKGR